MKIAFVDQGYKNPVGLLTQASHTNFMLPCRVSVANSGTQ
jgi:hypothetical protein